MKGYAELEIVFQRNSLDEFQASFRQRFDESENITPFIPLALNIHDPTFYSGNPQRMGQLLSESLFMPPALRDAFTSARAFSDHQQSTLKIRLLIDSNASILHSLPWETLVDPTDTATHLLRSNQCVFSRYLAARTYRLPMLRPKQGIKALLAIANPQGLSETFTPINVPQEQELAENALRHVPLTTLTRRGSATLRAIIEGIKEEPTLSISCATALSGSKAPCCGWKMRPGMPPASPAKISPRVWARWKEFPAWSSYAPAKAPVPAIPHATRWSPRAPC